MRALFVFSGLLFYFSAFSQNAIRFAYDALGNRMKREIVLQNSDVAKRNLSSEEKTDPYLAQPNGRTPESGNPRTRPRRKSLFAHHIDERSSREHKRNNLPRFRTRPEPLH